MAWTNFDSDYESMQLIASADVSAGDTAKIQDTIVVALGDAKSGDPVTWVYKCASVIATKKSASSAQAVTAGELVRYHTGGNDIGNVSAQDAATTTVIACGFALEDAATDAGTVRIMFNGESRSD